MSRNPLLLKCKKCGDFQHHWIMPIEHKTMWIDKESKKKYESATGLMWNVCYNCDTLRDCRPIRDVDFKVSTLEVSPLESGLNKEGDTRGD